MRLRIVARHAASGHDGVGIIPTVGTTEHLGMLDLERGPRIVCIPSTDPDMCGVVERLFKSIEWVTPERLEAALREVYPKAIVRRRELSNEPMPTWYVFRERGGSGLV